MTPNTTLPGVEGSAPRRRSAPVAGVGETPVTGASAPRRGRLRFVSEVAAFLRMEPAEVRALIDLDGLPAKRVPGAKRAVLRVFLPDFWRWFCDRPGETGMELASYARFETEFEAAQGRGGDA